MTEMTAKEFAENFAGQRVFTNKSHSEKGRVWGYALFDGDKTPQHILVEAVDVKAPLISLLSGPSWAIFWTVSTEPKPLRGWCIPCADLCEINVVSGKKSTESVEELLKRLIRNEPVVKQMVEEYKRLQAEQKTGREATRQQAKSQNLGLDDIFRDVPQILEPKQYRVAEIGKVVNGVNEDRVAVSRKLLNEVLGHLTGLDLSHHSVAPQRAHREVVSKLMDAMDPKRSGK